MAKVEIVAERCKSCGYCVKFCPKQVLEIGTGVNSKGYEYVVPVRPEDCIGCRHLRPHGARTGPSRSTSKGRKAICHAYL